MRAAFISTLVELAERDDRILLLTGDLGFMALEPFSDRFPDRFVNVGVAEQNMVGVATGLAEAGFLPYVYSIVTFASLRAYEFIRNGPILHQLPVRIVGVGGGFEYGTAGPSHHGLEDVGVMRLQPNLAIIAPADYQQARVALEATWDLPGPVYYRIGKDDRTLVPGLDGRFELGRGQTIGDGGDALFVTMGSIASEVVAAASVLTSRGIACTVMVIASVSPPPTDDLMRMMERFPQVMTVEAHYAVGGIGSLVADVIATKAINCRLIRSAVTSLPHGISGSQDSLHALHGLSKDRLIDTMEQLIFAGGC
jgi:transketolase